MIEYRLATSADLKQVANIHKEQFPDHYLGQFSTTILERFYECLLDAGYIFVVAADEGQILGFVLGGEWTRISETLSRFMKNNFLRSLLESAIRPKTWKKSVQKFKGFFSSKVSDPKNLDNIERFTLLSIATGKDAQGKGIGKGLVERFNIEMRKISTRYYLSVQDTNDRAIRLYHKLGFVDTYLCPGEIQMIKTLE